MIRQGDVLLVPLTAAPDTGTERPRDNGRVVLAYGEVTGHAHAIEDQGVALLDLPGQVWPVLRGGGTLGHEEHTAFRLDAPAYRVIQQGEYAPAAIRNVAD